MKRLIVCIMAMATVALGGHITPAHSTGVSVAAIVGTGTITPGLTTASAAQDVSFTGLGAGGGAVTGAGVGTAGPLVDCAFNGSGVGSVISGSGTVDGTCNGNGPLGTGAVTCDNLPFAQVGGIVVVGPHACSATAAGPAGSGASSGTVGGVFLFVPTSGPQVVSYALAGVAAGVAP